MTNRRPIASRNLSVIQKTATRLAHSSVTPNQISQASVGFAALAFAAFWLSAAPGPILTATLLLIAALGIQARLLCNLLDGMVAVEGGKSAPDGPFWNEAPDRAADFLILTGAGLAIHQPLLGLAASALAILTAYLRELGRAEGLPPDFTGPMAKPHRMAAITIGALAALIETLWLGSQIALLLSLWVVVIGSCLTVSRRSTRLIAGLNARD